MARLEAAISEATSSLARLSGTRQAQGGCISESNILSLEDGRRYFLKTHSHAERYPGFFEVEHLA